jgi:3-phenylpropionate/trans-cinnamate dioxygenase ferredoxin component
MSNFVKACKLSEIPVNGKLGLEIGDRFVVVAQVEGEYYCLDDVCTHDGGTLGDGELEGHCLVCPRHGAKFDVRNGDAVFMPATEPTTAHAVRVDGEYLYVSLRQ